jgi:nucleoside-diphosphate-sugar epimerase
LQPFNIDLTLNVFEAAARAKARRLIFASSNWAMAGYRPATGPITTDAAPFPINGYGATKLMGERAGRFFSDTRGLSVICLRIGMAERPGGTRPGPETPQGLWGQQMWLSDRDMLQGFVKAVEAPADLRFAVVNLMSANEGMRWDIEATRQAIGYVPQDSHPTYSSASIELQERLVCSTLESSAQQLALVSSGPF